VATVGVTFRIWVIWANNLQAISPPVRIIQMLGMGVGVCLLLLSIVAVVGGNVMAAGSSIALIGLVLGSGDALMRVFGRLGGWLVFVSISVCIVAVLPRWSRSRPEMLRASAFGLIAFLAVQPVFSVVSNLPSSTDRVEMAPIPRPVRNGHPADLFVVILDEYASPATLEEFGGRFESFRNQLTTQGFLVQERAWSHATSTTVAVGGLANLGVPLKSRQPLTKSEDARLFSLIGGGGRLFELFHKAGFGITYIESGWYGSACRRAIDSCVKRLFVDDVVEQVINPSLVGDLWNQQTPGAFALGGLHALQSAVSVAEEVSANGQNDLVFAHVLLPHFPYRLNEGCERSLISEDAASAIQEREAYLAQVGCVNRWLEALTGKLPPEVAVLITGDHGTTLRRQMFRDPTTWSEAEIAERAGIFLATRFPDTCSAPRADMSLIALGQAADCLLGTDVSGSISRKTWLFALDRAARCIEPPTVDTPSIEIEC
jgi:hypothetical protein